MPQRCYAKWMIPKRCYVKWLQKLCNAKWLTAKAMLCGVDDATAMLCEVDDAKAMLCEVVCCQSGVMQSGRC